MCPRGLLGLSSKTQDEEWDFFEKLAWNAYELEQARGTLGYPTHGESIFPVSPYPQDHFIQSYDPSYSFVPPVLCDYYVSSDLDACTYPYCDYVDATCANIEKKINELADKMVEIMKEKIVEYSQCFNRSRKDTNLHKSGYSLGSPKPEVSLYDDFEPSYLARPNLNDDMPLPSLEQESDLPLSLSPDLAPEFSTPTDATEDFLVSAIPPATLNDSFKFEDGEESNRPSELDMSLAIEIEPHDLDNSEDISQESSEKEDEPTNLKFDDDILSIEYQSFSCGFDINESLDEGFYVEYKSFFFLTPSLLTSPLNLASLNLLGLRTCH